MVEIAKYPFDGYKLYVVLHRKQGRRMANLVKLYKTGRTTISYARYLMSVHLNRKLNNDEYVDHINGDKLDDRIENFQLLTNSENIKKSAKGRTVGEFKCPVCGIEFIREIRQTHSDSPCCSRRCGGIKSANK